LAEGVSVIAVIAIDGPAAAGKTAVGRALARRLGFQYLDTGIMYRAVAWLAREKHVPVDDDDAVGALAEGMALRVLDSETDRVMIGDREVDSALQSPDVARNASLVAAIPRVRRAMVRQQRDLAGQGNIVMVGRDIGTVVLPNADLKVYLTASVEERARRRWRQFRQEGREVDYEDVLQETRARDRRDTTRADSPLRAAEDALQINSDHLSVEQVVDRIFEQIALLSK
jgi:CMP/dCMP kinase